MKHELIALIIDNHVGAGFALFALIVCGLIIYAIGEYHGESLGYKVGAANERRRLSERVYEAARKARDAGFKDGEAKGKATTWWNLNGPAYSMPTPTTASRN